MPDMLAVKGWSSDDRLDVYVLQTFVKLLRYDEASQTRQVQWTDLWSRLCWLKGKR